MGPGLTIAAAGLVTVVGAIVRKQSPSPRIFVGTAVAGGAILAIASWNAEVASKLALVVFLTALLTSGYDVARGVNQAINRTPGAKPA